MIRGYYGGHCYSLPVNNDGVPLGLVKQVRGYDPKLDVKYIPALRCWGLFRLMQVREMFKENIPIRGNGIDPEYQYQEKFKTLIELRKVLFRKELVYLSFDKYYNRIIQAEAEEEELENRRIREDFLYHGRNNARYYKKLIKPFESANDKHFNALIARGQMLEKAKKRRKDYGYI